MAQKLETLRRGRDDDDGDRSAWLLFLGHWLRHPTGIGSILPSSPAVGRTVARLAPLDRPGAVLELGGGTGSLTRYLLEAGCAPERLVVLEREPALAAFLRRRFPKLKVLCADACDLGAELDRERVGTLATVVSSLPIRWFPLEASRAIVDQAFGRMEAGGTMLQLTNGPTSPIPLAPLGLDGAEAARVWLNLLPMRVWRYRRAGDAAAPQH